MTTDAVMESLRIEFPDGKPCTCCKACKPISDFPIFANRGKFRPYSKCRECRKAYNRSPKGSALEKERREKFPEKLKAKAIVKKTRLNPASLSGQPNARSVVWRLSQRQGAVP